MFEPVTLCTRRAILGMDSPSSTPCVSCEAMSFLFQATSFATSSAGTLKSASPAVSMCCTVGASTSEKARSSPLASHVWKAAKLAFSAYTSGSLPASAATATSFACE